MPPDAAGDAAPQCRDDAPSPVDNPHMIVSSDGFHDFMSDIFFAEQQGIVLPAVEQSGVNKTWSDVGETDVQFARDGLLLECLEVSVLEGFRGRVGWCHS